MKRVLRAGLLLSGVVIVAAGWAAQPALAGEEPVRIADPGADGKAPAESKRAESKRAESKGAQPNRVEPKVVDPKAAASAAEERAQPIDRLFERLAAAKDEGEGSGIAKLIERQWMRSGSDTADLLMGRAIVALAAKDQPLAIELLDRVVTLEPRWAEAWNKRATIFFLMGDYDRSMADIRQALSIEPRHFGAWSGMGAIFRASDDDKHALEAFRRALALNPFMDDVKSLVDRLSPDVDGRDL